MLVIWLCSIAKRLLAILQQPIAKHMLAILATSYCLNRNDRVSSFYWTRGSKQWFLTCFSYFSCYFPIPVFSQNCYLLISLRLSRLHGNPMFSSRFLVTLALQASTSYMPPHVSGTEGVGFLKQDAHGNLVVASLPVNFPFSAFCWRFLVQTSIGEHESCLSFLQKSSDWHFLAWPWPSQATQYSPGMESPRDIQIRK